LKTRRDDKDRTELDILPQPSE